MTQQATPETELEELTGIEGLRAALAEPGLWQCDWPGDRGNWGILATLLDQNIGSKYLAQHGRRWRRIPEPKRAVLRPNSYSWSLTGGLSSSGFTMPIGEGCVPLTLSLGDHWVGRRLRIEVAELTDCEQPDPKPSADDPPGTVITWQRAQERLDSGLAVEFEGGTADTWALVNPEHHVCGNRRRYRIPMQPAATDPPAEMDAERATEWLRGGTDRAVYDTEERASVWMACDIPGSSKLPNLTYRPLVPLTRGQLAEIERLQMSLGAFEVELSATRRERDNWKAACNKSCATLRSVTDARDDALAALEQERGKNSDLMGAIMAANAWLQTDASCIASRKDALTRALKKAAETTGKEAGG